MRYVTELGFLTSELVLKNLVFFLFLGFMATIYIANAHYAEKNVRRIQFLQKELKELRWYYMSLEAENMFNSRRTEMAEKVKSEGLYPLDERPKKIVIKK